MVPRPRLKTAAGLLLLAGLLKPDVLAAGDLPDAGAVADEADASPRAAEALSGDTLRLADGRELKLAGVGAPLPAGSDRLAEAARRLLQRLAADKPLRLEFDRRPRNRYGQLLAQAHVPGRDGREVWLQAALLKQGLARVRGLPENTRAWPELLAIEDAARREGRGLWAYHSFAVIGPEAAARHVGSFQIVEGRVLSAAVVRKRGYLNFGEDWKTDFTVSLDRAALERFEESGLALASLEGRRLRVRGWLDFLNGPMIEIGYPEQIELLEP